jgi:hypothetical protein
MIYSTVSNLILMLAFQKAITYRSLKFGFAQIDGMLILRHMQSK